MWDWAGGGGGRGVMGVQLCEYENMRFGTMRWDMRMIVGQGIGFPGV